MSFADDVLSLASTKEGIQDQAEVMSTSSIIMGIFFAIKKLRTSAITWGQEPSCYMNKDYHNQAYDKDWNSTQIPVKYANLAMEDQSLRYLGVQTDFRNLYHKQFKTLKEGCHHSTTSTSQSRHYHHAHQTLTLQKNIVLWQILSMVITGTPDVRHTSQWAT